LLYQFVVKPQSAKAHGIRAAVPSAPDTTYKERLLLGIRDVGLCLQGPKLRFLPAAVNGLSTSPPALKSMLLMVLTITDSHLTTIPALTTKYQKKADTS